MLYHVSLGLPESIKDLFGLYESELTCHAINASESDKYGIIEIPCEIEINEKNIIEVEINDFIKIVVRQSYNDDFDLCLVVVINGCKAIIKTLWLNDVLDNHMTLDASRYDVCHL